jgi:UDP-N-acetylglucosamine/UDP-N-acetylgalactosamine diphosphorylase
VTDALSEHLERAQACGQDHLVQAASSLDAAGRATLAESMAFVPWDELDHLRELVLGGDGDSSAPVGMRPPQVHDVISSETRACGEALLSKGAVAVFTVAGGQGTRLGWNGPKGTFPATPIMGKSLFGLLAERIAAIGERYGTPVRWYIMTSIENDASTRAFMQDNRFFGLDRRNVQMFQQGMMPVFDAATGQLLLAAPDRLALSPDGHGGSFAALLRSGALEHMERRAIEHVSYVQIDNPLVRVLDPAFLGLHVDASVSSGEFSSKVVPRAHAEEKVGVFVQCDAGMRVVEYSDLEPEQAQAVDDTGALQWRAANLAVHALSVAFMRRVAQGGTASLPWHRAFKPVSYWCPQSQRQVQGEASNGVKLERFVFDALTLAERPVLLQVDRADEFAPIKNKDGDDSAASSARMQIELHGQWLEQHGVSVPRADDGQVDAQIEIAPAVAQWPEDLDGVDLPDSVQVGEQLVLSGT